jgi:hypothetical protein
VTDQKQLRLERWLCVTPAVAAALGYTVFVIQNAVNVVYLDYWASVPVLHAFDDGRLSLSQLWTPAANNRVVVPRVITLAVGRLFRLDARVEIIGAVALLAVAVVLLMLTQRRNDGGPLHVYAPIAFFMFSIVQWQTALWNVQMPRYLILALFALALFLVCRSSGWGSLALAALAAVVASLSLLDGFLLWPAIAIIIWWDGRPQRERRVGAWAAVGLVTAAVYSVGYDFGANSNAGYVIRHPLASVRYFVVLVGGFTRAAPAEPGLALGCGVLMIGLCAWVVTRFWRSDRTLADTLPVALVAFVLLFDVWTLLGRGSAGQGQALASRYTTYNLLIFVAAYLALINRGRWRVAEERRVPVLSAVAGIGFALSVLLVSASVTTARHEGTRFAAQLRTSARVLRNYRTEPATRIEQYLCPAFCLDLVRREAPFLEAHHYSVFANTGAPAGRSVVTVPEPGMPQH